MGALNCNLACCCSGDGFRPFAGRAWTTHRNTPQGPDFSGFRKRGLANGIFPFFSENETEKNGRQRKKTEEKGKKTRKNGKNGRKRKKKRKISEVTPFRRPLLRNPEILMFGESFGKREGTKLLRSSPVPFFAKKQPCRVTS